MAAFSIVLITALDVVGNPIEKLALLTPFLFCIAWSLPRQKRGLVSGIAAAFLFLYLLTVAVELLRAAHSGFAGLSQSTALEDITGFVVICVFGITLITSARNGRERWWRLIAIALSPAVYIGVNTILLQIYGQPTMALSVAQGTPSELLGYFGISATRVLFPLSPGVNFTGAVAAAGLASAVLLLVRASLDRRVAVVAILVCLYGVLATDSRGALLLSLAVVLAFVLAPRIRASAGVAVLVPAAPILIGLVLGLLASSSGSLGLFLRPGAQDVSTVTARLQIWHSVWGVLSHPSLEQLIGYGANGQVTSGASLHYAYLFAFTQSPDTISTHNLVLQTILDAGYIGLAAMIAALVVCAFRLERGARAWPRSPSPAMLAILAVIFLSGATEAVPTYLAPDAMGLVLLVMGASVALADPRSRSYEADGLGPGEGLGPGRAPTPYQLKGGVLGPRPPAAL